MVRPNKRPSFANERAAPKLDDGLQSNEMLATPEFREYLPGPSSIEPVRMVSNSQHNEQCHTSSNSHAGDQRRPQAYPICGGRQKPGVHIKTIEALFPSGFIQPNSFDIASASVLDNPLFAIYPFGSQPENQFFLNGCNLRNLDFVKNSASRLYTRWLSWYIELEDHLVRSICPSDLNNMPCEWDELPDGCPMLRLCTVKRNYHLPNPNHTDANTILPTCTGESRNTCIYIHDIAPNCRSINKQAMLKDPSHQFRSTQLCTIVANQAAKPTSTLTEEDYCAWGHDFEGARLESVWRYWEHKAQARRRGSEGVIKTDRVGRPVFKPQRPDIESLAYVQKAKVVTDAKSPQTGIDAPRYVGRTFHGHLIRLSFEVGEMWHDGNYYTFSDLDLKKHNPLDSELACEDGEKEEHGAGQLQQQGIGSDPDSGYATDWFC